MEIKTSCDIAYEFQQKETDNVRWVRVDDINKELLRHRNHPCGHHEIDGCDDSCIEFILHELSGVK